MTAQELIKSSLRLIGVVAPGETPSADEMQDGLTSLNTMLDLWSSKRLAVPVLTTENYTLVPGTAQYTIGSGATWDTPRPLRIINAYVRDGNIDYPIRIRTRKEFNRIALKTVQARPEYLWYDNQFPIGIVNLYYTPDDTDTIFIDSWKALTSIATLTTTLSFPEGYESALKYNLAIQIAPEYGATVAPAVAAIAKDSFTTIKNFNSPRAESVLDLPTDRGGNTFNIRTGFGGY